MRLLPTIMMALTAACTPSTPSATPSVPNDSAPGAPTKPVAEQANAKAGGLQLVVRNDTAKTLTLDRSFGPAEPFRLARMDGDLPDGVVFDDVDDAASGAWISTCVCACDGSPCSDCEPPPNIDVTLETGERYAVSTTGQLRHWTDKGCAQRLPTPPGRYVITVCTEEEVCGRTVANLPSQEPVEVLLSTRGKVDTCADVPSARLPLWVHRMASAHSVLVTCPSEPTCVPTRQEVPDHTAECAAWVVPAGDRVELWLTLPDRREIDWLDPDITRTISGRHDR